MFFNEEFGHVLETTGSRRPTDGLPSISVHGKRTLLALFKPAERLPEHQISFNMWIDDRTKLPLIRDSLRNKTKVDATLVPQQRRVDGQFVNSFDITRAVFPSAALKFEYERRLLPGILRPEPQKDLTSVTLSDTTAGIMAPLQDGRPQ